MDKFRLKEYIGLENYNWENALLTYVFDEKPKANVIVTSGSNETTPCQIGKTGDGKYAVSLVTGLKSGEEKEFAFQNDGKNYNSIAYDRNGITVLDNEGIEISVDPDGESLFEIKNKLCRTVGRAELSAPIADKKIETLENGAVFARVKIWVQLENGGSYSVILCLAREQEFVTLTEDIGTDGEKMRIVWKSFSPVKRLSAGTRATQAIDEYLKPNKEIPVLLLPHDVTSGVVETPFITFFDDKASVGVFIGDSEKWWDGSYSIQSNNKLNAVRFFYDESVLDKFSFEYPLNSGSRETCIAMYASETEYKSKLRSHIRELQFWNYYLPLDEYKDYIFDYDDSNEKYPKYFDKERFDKDRQYHFPGGYDKNGIPPADEVLKRIEECEIVSDPWHFGPVWSRVFGEIVPLLDLEANEMKREDFKKARNICVLFAYYAMRENPFPTRHTLAGHANFCMDYVSIVGLAAAMFPHHPDAEKWKNYYHRAVLLNMKFYVRPDVKAWGAKGGRSTENLGCYSWAGLRHILSTGEMIDESFGDNPALCRNFAKWAEWFLNSLSSPINNRRAFPPLGAHAGGHTLNPYYPTFYFRVMGKMLKNYSPLLAEQILNVCPAEPLVQLENFEKNDVWSYMNKNADTGNAGIRPDLKSEKFTGFGYVMRSHMNRENEMCVLLQQIDEGPNYRWGSSCNGGCGNIYYYADNKRFSDNRKEDVGDDIMADCDVSCCFAVLQGKHFTSVGMNELTYPLSDFGFCQYARVNAGAYSSDEYNYRSVLMADNDYIAIYDSVRDYRTEGRFSWFSNEKDEMPDIYNLKPGLSPREVKSPQLTVIGDEYNHRANGMDIPDKTRGVMYDGRGDFFTVVTHKKELKPEKRDFGTVVKKKNSVDYVFDAPYRLNVCEKEAEFSGRVGFARIYGENEYDLAIFDGSVIGAYETRLKAYPISEHFSISLRKRNGRLFGKCCGSGYVEISDKDIGGGYKLFINSEFSEAFGGQRLLLSDCEWELTDGEPQPSAIGDISYCEDKDGVHIKWNCRGGRGYVAEVGGTEYRTQKPELCLKLDTGKYIVRIRTEDGTRESMDYPMYITKEPPKRVEGVLLTRHKDFAALSWGEQLGVLRYKLYKAVCGEKPEIIYTGSRTEYDDFKPSEGASWFVTAENGIGESEASLVRTLADGGMSDWDPVPDTEFIRDTINNEHGFAGFDYKYNENRKILKYPK